MDKRSQLQMLLTHENLTLLFPAWHIAGVWMSEYLHRSPTHCFECLDDVNSSEINQGLLDAQFEIDSFR